MLTIEIKINGHLISYTTAVNKGLYETEYPEGVGYRYEVEVFTPGELVGLHRMEIKHIRAEGAHVLARKILEAMADNQTEEDQDEQT